MVDFITSYDDILVGDFLERYGVKGMRWGVITQPRLSGAAKSGSSSKPSSGRKPANKDNSTQPPSASPTAGGGGTLEVDPKTDKELQKLLDKGLTMEEAFKQLVAEGYDVVSVTASAMERMTPEEIAKATTVETVSERHETMNGQPLPVVTTRTIEGTNPDGTKYTRKTSSDGKETVESTKPKNRPFTKEETEEFRRIQKAGGRVYENTTGFDGKPIKKKVDRSRMAHEELSDYLIEDFLEHHGIKGMKWGVRRTDAQLGRPSKSKPAWLSKKVSDLKKKVSGSSLTPEQKKALARDFDGDKVKSSSNSQNGSKQPRPEKPVVEVTVQKPVMDNNELRALVERTRLLKELDSLSNPPSTQQVKTAAQELQEKINVIKLEREYKQLTTPKTAGSALRKAGADLATSVLKDSAKVALTAYTTAAMKKGLGTAFKGMGIDLKSGETKPNANLKAAVDKIKLERELAKLQTEGKKKD